MQKHQDGCPLSATSAYKAAALRGQANYIPELSDSDHDRPCPDRRCSTWLDLHTWFGYQPKSLPQIDFQKCFCDIAHGGKGVYERLAVLGEKGLEMMAKVYISDKFSPVNCIPFELQRSGSYPQDMIRYIWTLKRVDRVISLRSLSTFAKIFLSTPQSMPTASCAARYVKAITGFSIQAHSLMRTSYAENHALETMAYARNDSNLKPLRKPYGSAAAAADVIGQGATSGLVYHWAGILIDHIYESQKLKTGGDPIEAELVQDLQEYFGYPYDSIIPRIRNIINSTDTTFTEAHFDAQAETGRDIIRLWITNYFMSVAKHSLLDPDTLERWLRLEVETFMGSQVIAIFAATHFNLLPILNHIYGGGEGGGGSGVLSGIMKGAGGLISGGGVSADGGAFGPTPRWITSPATGEKVEVIRRIDNPRYGPGLIKVERMFLQLLAASYSVVKESDSKRYMPALCQRLRQIQLILHLEELDIRVNGPLKSPLALFQGIDIYRWSSISHWGHNNRFGLWHNHPEGNHLDAFLPVSDPVIRRRVRQLENLSANAQAGGGCCLSGGGRGGGGGGNPSVCQILCKKPPGLEPHVDESRSRRRVRWDDEEGGAAGDGVMIPIANDEGNYLSRFATNKKLGHNRRRSATNLFSRIFKAGSGRGGELPLWKPPFATFMAPRPVTFNKGEAYVSPHYRTPLPTTETAQAEPGRLNVDWSPTEPPPPPLGPQLVTPVREPFLTTTAAPASTTPSAATSSSYCSSCSTCVGEQPHDCKGWNSVLREVQRNMPDPPFRYQRIEGPNNVVVVQQNNSQQAVDIYRRRLDDQSVPFKGVGFNGAGCEGRLPLGERPSSILDRELVDDPDFRQLIHEGPDSIRPVVGEKILGEKILGEKILGMNFDHDIDGHKRLQINSPENTVFRPPPNKSIDPNLIDIKLPAHRGEAEVGRRSAGG